MSPSRARRKLLGRLRRRKTREREGRFLVEGVRSAVEALDASARISFALVSPRLEELPGGERLAERLAGAGVDVERVDDEELRRLSDTESPQGVLLVCEEPRPGLSGLGRRVDGGGAPGPRVLVVDGVQDPGNLGTLVRAAAAFGLDAVLSLEGTVDPYNPKAVRAAAGGLFHVPVVVAPWEDVDPWLGSRAVRLLVADAGGTDVALVDRSPPWALVIGGEGAGVRDELRRAAAEVVAVPMRGRADSLNAGVAGAILLHVLDRETGIA